ncbi:sensor histidine kinase [Rhizobium tibeticum]|uniref:sensor histidine kinase n=1 Tax=Rhizobium tibeticum TaxID=501024 RepID=UPI000930D5E6|nr:ATP-binding protein [Rhizobium tibeticum]
MTSQFLIVASLFVGCSMTFLGVWLSSQIAANQLYSRANSGALYMEGFLSRHVQSGETGPTVSTESMRELDQLLMTSDLAYRIESFRIWRSDGLILYSTDKSVIGKTFSSSNLVDAFSGRVVAQLEYGHNDEGQTEPTSAKPLLEIYAPIFAAGTRNPIAVGEIYEDATDFVERRNVAQRRTWYLIAAATVSIIGALYVVVHGASNLILTQRSTLERQLIAANALAEQNKELRQIADETRLQSAESNETLLNRIGSDLHDGPLQLLGLLILRLGDPSLDKGTGETSATRTNATLEALSPQRIATDCLNQLRDLSSGLVMPEIEELSLEAALKLAVDRHRTTTGSHVDVDFDRLPLTVASSLKICLYRIVQEGLNNSFRHGNGIGQHVRATAEDGAITVVVSDQGPGFSASASGDGRQSLGLLGIRNRAAVLQGTFTIGQRKGGGTELVVTIPMEGNSEYEAGT